MQVGIRGVSSWGVARRCALLVATTSGLHGCTEEAEHADGAGDAAPVSCVDEHLREIACPGGLTCCRPTCADLTVDPDHCGSCSTPCPPPYTCDQGVCRCGELPEYLYCDGACANTHGDPRNCGACGHNCTLGMPTAECRSGVCAP